MMEMFRSIVAAAVVTALLLFLKVPAAGSGVSIAITNVPEPYQTPGPYLATGGGIAGTVHGQPAGAVVVCYAQGGGVWYVQPWADEGRITKIDHDHFDTRVTHPGDMYLAFVVATAADAMRLPSKGLPDDGSAILAKSSPFPP